MGDLTDSKTSAQRDYIAADNAYREASAAHRAAHSAAIAELLTVDFASSADVLAWMRERTDSTKARLAVAEDDLQVARIDLAAIDDALIAETQAARAKRDAVRYADKLDEVRDTAETALALASRAVMSITGASEIKF